MKITNVRVRRISEEGKMKAIVSVTFNEQFVVHDIKIIDGQNGLFIAMPSRKMGEGDFRDIAHPLISETRNKIINIMKEKNIKQGSSLWFNFVFTFEIYIFAKASNKKTKTEAKNPNATM